MARNCQEQAKRLKKIGKPLGAFRRCGQCGGADVWRMYDPDYIGFEYWCITCGAKDAKTGG